MRSAEKDQSTEVNRLFLSTGPPWAAEAYLYGGDVQDTWDPRHFIAGTLRHPMTAKLSVRRRSNPRDDARFTIPFFNATYHRQSCHFPQMKLTTTPPLRPCATADD